MSPTPRLDNDAKVGLTFISVGYGVVLVAVFPPHVWTLKDIGVAGWFHLALASVMIVVSWMGYYTNRQDFPVWRVQFFNIPLVQYLISFLILFGYWLLGLTIESPRAVSTTAHPVIPSPKPELWIVFAIFLAYLVWDCLEITVQESAEYRAALPADRRPSLPSVMRSARGATLGMCVIYGVILLVTLGMDLRGTWWTATIDGVLILSLFFYRWAQRLAIEEA